MSAYNVGYQDGYEAAYAELAEHEAKIYAVAFASGMRAGNWQANQSITKDGWAEQ